MAARDRGTMIMKCPSCGTGGIAKTSTDDHPYMRDTGFMVDEYPKGLHEHRYSRYPDETEVKCECGQIFKLGQMTTNRNHIR